MNLHDLVKDLKVKNKDKKIIFADSDDIRVREAVTILSNNGHQPIICGRREALTRYSQTDITTIEVSNSVLPNVLAAQLVSSGQYHAVISGNLSPSADVIKSLIQNIGTKEGIQRLSSHFLMDTQLGLFLFADAAVQANPNAHQLAEIALLTAQSAIRYGITPKIAMLSFSTSGSAHHEMVTKVQNATLIAKELLEKNNIDAIIEGELQIDSAISPEISLLKNPQSQLKGEANILIFPDLNSANIGYKLVQRFASAQAIGPIIQGLHRPGNDLSRGCSVEDILNLYYITANS